MAQHVWTIDDVRDWFAERVPPTWFTALKVAADREEIVVVGELPGPDGPAGARPAPAGAGHDRTGHRLACTARIQQFRDDTREERVAIAEEAELLWARKVSWGVSCGGFEELFTTHSVPVMTRLRMTERAVLDTLIDAGVARTRSEALAWCVRLVGSHEQDWIAELRAALARVEALRRDGPGR